ncbi:tRNA-dihydrouridine(16) synthase [Psychrosphaera saromensis]|uniref:tRNA-dihydrouridine(16) synthase n=1 Tax=Psychrosphaera saromensis TaxID=716813 RepID=A0A2S7UZ82_9GAMM|nr:tRNA-dihydrouridine synthase [Psychrosphaera saromensis]PQJ54580.1 tRNA dihydrouridine(16) synthase DusC [Psychrosphaera saromensis]GHB58802.1 tRNA-dihydrouridine(16) synthase [Psychrosphaera saromensis]GLQ14203.1 tRNA-dihydrouridine(16) synthase [Psychrosphaera saromensis]
MKIVLAPMEGVIDHLMRHMLTSLGGIDLCMTEFVRIVDQKLPERVYYRYCPELHHGGKTPSGVPVRVQLLGQDPDWLSENAVVATSLGSPGIDLNFGCPAPLVNRNKGGAILLKEPDALYRIVKAVRAAVPGHLPVTAKMRLGYEDKSLAVENAQALSEAGASEIAIHARTKSDGYKPPAYWDSIAEIKKQVDTPLIANGEIWNPEHAKRCQQQSNCDNIMLGRGALAVPNLAAWIRGSADKLTWNELLALMLEYSKYEIEGDKGLYYSNRVKQWFVYIKQQYPEAEPFFRQIRVIKKADEMYNAIKQQLLMVS